MPDPTATGSVASAAQTWDDSLMEVGLIERRAAARGVEVAAGGGAPVYAIAFDLNQEALKRDHPSDSPLYAHEQIKTVLERHGFSRQQGSVYFGNTHVTPVTTVLAVQELARRFTWFNSEVVTDIRMLRIEENNDLNPAIVAIKSHGEQGQLGPF